MPKKNEQSFENRLENNNDESRSEFESEIIPEVTTEITAENFENVAGKLESVRQEIASVTQSTETSGRKISNDDKIKQYQDIYLPKYLKEKRGVLSDALIDIWSSGTKFETEGKENIPETGPFLVVCNHFGANDVQALLKTFKDENLHLVVGKNAWWDRSVIARWFMKQLKVIPVQESLSNLSDEEKEEALKRQGRAGQAMFKKVIGQEKQDKLASNIEFIRQAVAVLSQGDAIGIFPEGLWLNPQGLSREKPEMKKGYRGLELIATHYKKVTGQDLPILPTAFNEDQTNKNKKLIIGQEIILADNDSKLNGTDWCMKKIAEMLPQEKRGYYAKLAE